MNGDGSGKPPPIIQCVSSAYRRCDDEEDATRCEILNVLVQHGADVNVQVEEPGWLRGETAAMFASERNFLRCLQLLVVCGADLSMTCCDGDTALMRAARQGHLHCVKYLTEHMSSALLNLKNSFGTTALMMAVLKSGENNFLCMQHLISAGVDLAVQDSEGSTALALAVRKQHANRVKYLIEHMSAEMLNLRDIGGRTALMLAASRSKENHFLSLQHLVAAGADLDLKDREGHSALVLALEHSSAEAVSLLLENGADVNTMNNSGVTPLMLSVKKYSTEAVALLLNKGADPNPKVKPDNSPLMLAVKHSTTKVVRLLVEQGAHLNTVTATGESLLSVTLSYGLCFSDSNAIELLSHGLDPTLSRGDRDCLHDMVVEGPDVLVRALVMAGFPPLDLICHSYNAHYMVRYESVKPMSPLAVAILCGHLDIAKYLIANRFFTRFDAVRLSWDPEIRRSLMETLENFLPEQDFNTMGNSEVENRDVHPGYDENRSEYHRWRQCMQIIDFLSSAPMSLRTLSLIAISSALSQDLVRDLSNTPELETEWICKPTFKQKVASLEIPPALKRELLHQTPISSICTHCWEDIALGKEACFHVCHCKDWEVN